jgi:acetylornithine deacetylase/succinyl-diaminopimelate desuccinylase family protein
MNAREQIVLKKIDTDELVALAQDLLRIPSVNPPGDYERISCLIYEQMTTLGLETSIIEGRPGKPNVFGRYPGHESDAPVLLLSGHMDVVPVPDPSMWRYPPFEGQIADGKIWGRGAVDMKGALAAEIIALKAVMESGIELRGTVILGATVDDETAGLWGMRYVMEEGLDSLQWPRPTFHLLGEANDLNITNVFKGRLWLKITVEGKSAHGGEPQAGINAIEKMIKLIERLKIMRKNQHPLAGEDTLNIGKIQGGEAVNVVPHRCVAHFDFRIAPPGKAKKLEERIKEIVLQLEKEDTAFSVGEFETYERRDPVETDPDHWVVKASAGCVEAVTGRRPGLEGTLSAGDLYYAIKRGIPGLWIGAGDGRLRHSDNEHLAVDDLIRMAKIYALMIVGMCA